jgi:hypothetical protein
MDKMTMTSEQTLAVQAGTTLAPLHGNGAIAAFASMNNFEAAQRMAKALASSTMVPTAYQNNVPNVLVAMELAARTGASIFSVLQNLDIIHGRPSWRSTFLIATINASGKFSPIEYRFSGKPNTDEWTCVAVATDLRTGKEVFGPEVSIAMAKGEGWYSRNGSKWKTMPGLMLRYRAASFFARTECPELSLGMQTHEEVIDTVGYEVPEKPARVPSTSLQALEETILGTTPTVPKDVPSEPASGPRNVAVDDDGVVSENEEG